MYGRVFPSSSLRRFIMDQTIEWGVPIVLWTVGISLIVLAAIVIIMIVGEVFNVFGMSLVRSESEYSRVGSRGLDIFFTGVLGSMAIFVSGLSLTGLSCLMYWEDYVHWYKDQQNYVVRLRQADGSSLIGETVENVENATVIKTINDTKTINDKTIFIKNKLYNAFDYVAPHATVRRYVLTRVFALMIIAGTIAIYIAVSILAFRIITGNPLKHWHGPTTTQKHDNCGVYECPPALAFLLSLLAQCVITVIILVCGCICEGPCATAWKKHKERAESELDKKV